MIEVHNNAGELVYEGTSDADCVRWWQEWGRSGDYLADTGEKMSEVADQLDLDDPATGLVGQIHAARRSL